MGKKVQPGSAARIDSNSNSTESVRAGVQPGSAAAARAQERHARKAMNRAEHVLARTGWEELPPKAEDYADDLEFRRARGAWAARGLSHAAQHAEDERNQITARKAMAELDDKYIMHTEKLAKPDIYIANNVLGLSPPELQFLEAIGLAFDSPTDRARLSAAIADAFGSPADSDRPGGLRREQDEPPAQPVATGGARKRG